MYATKGMTVTELIESLALRTGLFGKYKKGLGHLQFREYELAYQVWLELAEGGHAQAQFDIGVMLHQGLGLNKDKERAIYWFEKAADQNHANAENFLGAIYKHGNGADQDVEKALMYFKRAMEHGSENAQDNYVDLLSHGLPSAFVDE